MGYTTWYPKLHPRAGARPIMGNLVSGRVVFSAILVIAAAATVQTANEDLRLPDPTYPAAVALWKDGRVSEALAALARQVGPTADTEGQPLEAVVLRAVLASEAGLAADAEADWRAVIAREVSMRTFSRRALVESQTSRGAPEAAEPFLAELARSDATRHLDMALLVADAYLERGAREPAAGHYRQVLRRQRRGAAADTARLGLGRTLEAAGDTEAALSTLRETRVQHWTADAYVEATAREHRLARDTGQTVQPLGDAQYRTLVRRLRNASRFPPALELIDDWRAAHGSTASADRIEAELISTLYARRANTEGVAACQRFYQRFPTSGLLPNIRQTDFRLAVRMADTERARGLGLDLWEGRVSGATSQQRRSAAELLAAHLVAVGDVDGGLELYRELFRSARSADDQRAMLWRAGVAALRDGQDERALINLRALIDRRPGGDLAPAGLYWLGAAEAQTGATDAAVRRFRAVAERYPYHYYGLRARARVFELTGGWDGAEAGGRPLDFPMLSLSAASRGRAEFKAATVLARAGLTDDAAWYLRRLLDQQRRDRGLALLAARASAEAGDYASVSRTVVNHFGSFLERPARGLPNDFWELVYPRPFWDAISGSARSHGVDPVLLLALMRQESRFDPEARSPVGAIGLLQIMPYTAQALAESAGVGEILGNGGVDEAALADPAINSAIAARLNADLLEMFDAAMPPVVASYNAGEERVAIWWAAARDLQEDFFVDTIPYSETRRFVREVLANYAAYERIYGDQ